MIKIVVEELDTVKGGKYGEDEKLDTLIEMLDRLAGELTPTMVVPNAAIDDWILVLILVVKGVVAGPNDKLGTVIGTVVDREMDNDITLDDDDGWLNDGLELDTNV